MQAQAYCPPTLPPECVSLDLDIHCAEQMRLCPLPPGIAAYCKENEPSAGSEYRHARFGCALDLGCDAFPPHQSRKRGALPARQDDGVAIRNKPAVFDPGDCAVAVPLGNSAFQRIHMFCYISLNRDDTDQHRSPRLRYDRINVSDSDGFSGFKSQETTPSPRTTRSSS